jgi:hypothetical protein
MPEKNTLKKRKLTKQKSKENATDFPYVVAGDDILEGVGRGGVDVVEKRRDEAHGRLAIRQSYVIPQGHHGGEHWRRSRRARLPKVTRRIQLICMRFNWTLKSE